MAVETVGGRAGDRACWQEAFGHVTMDEGRL